MRDGSQDIFMVEELTELFCALLTFKTGDLRSQHTIRVLEKELAALAAVLTQPHLVIDMSGVRMVPTAILGLMLQLVSDCRDRDIACRFCHLDESVKKAFTLLNVNKLVDVFPSRKEAIQTEWKKKRSWWPF